MRQSLTTALLLLALGTPAFAPAPPATATSSRCSLDLLHPLDLDIRLAEALEPGKWVRASLRVQSRLDLTDVRIDIQPGTQVELAGQAKLAAVEIAAQTPAEFSFDVRVPDIQEVLQVAVRVSGKAEGQPLERGAVLQLLPRGPHHPGVESPAPSGEQSVLEYRGAARRLP